MALTVQELRPLPLFETLSDDQLRWIVEHGEELVVPAGTRLFEEASAGIGFHVLLEGELQVFRHVGGRDTLMAGSTQPGVWAGLVPKVQESTIISARAGRDSRFLLLPVESMTHMLDSGFPIATHLLLGVQRGTENFQHLIGQQEKMAALGRLSAGLAHELNNPAAAARRAADQLRDALVHLERATVGVCDVGPSVLDRLRTDLGRRVGEAEALSSMDRSDLEDELGTWLDDRGIADPWDTASTLVDLGVDTACLGGLEEQAPGATLAAVVGWVAARAMADRLTTEVETSVGRISELVSAVKSYSYMDQAPVQDVDVHAGIDTTLTVLRHELKQGVEVVRDYDPGLPVISANGGELNQVWTNLIDNAVDAMGGKGTLRVATASDGDTISVAVTDDGPGIPEDIRSRIFDPFFTTKSVGEGTGLGLDIVHRIVVQSHGGEIGVDSEPGATTFTVRLPISPPAAS